MEQSLYPLAKTARALGSGFAPWPRQIRRLFVYSTFLFWPVAFVISPNGQIATAENAQKRNCRVYDLGKLSVMAVKLLRLLNHNMRNLNKIEMKLEVV
jgi:hypothetical protein